MSELGLVNKTVAVLRAVAAQPDGLGLSDAARATQLPKATCHRILTALADEGWLDADAETRRFRVSLSLSLLFQQDLSADSLVGHAKAALRDLASRARETAGLDRLDGSNVVVMAEVQGPHMIGQSVRPVPRLQEPWRTSTGKVLLAWRNADAVRPAFESAAVRASAGKYQDWRAFNEELDRVRERGYATAFDELETGMAAVAAPIWVNQRVDFAVWVGGPTFRITPETFDELAQTVIDVASRISDLLTRATPASGTVDLSSIALPR